MTFLLFFVHSVILLRWKLNLLVNSVNSSILLFIKLIIVSTRDVTSEIRGIFRRRKLLIAVKYRNFFLKLLTSSSNILLFFIGWLTCYCRSLVTASYLRSKQLHFYLLRGKSSCISYFGSQFGAIFLNSFRASRFGWLGTW